MEAGRAPGPAVAPVGLAVKHNARGIPEVFAQTALCFGSGLTDRTLDVGAPGTSDADLMTFVSGFTASSCLS